jgi:hypothetical protein
VASVAQGCLVCTASGVGVLGLRGCPRRLRSYALRTDLVARADPHSSHRPYRSRCRLIYRPRSYRKLFHVLYRIGMLDCFGEVALRTLHLLSYNTITANAMHTRMALLMFTRRDCTATPAPPLFKVVPHLTTAVRRPNCVGEGPREKSERCEKSHLAPVSGLRFCARNAPYGFGTSTGFALLDDHVPPGFQTRQYFV